MRIKLKNRIYCTILAIVLLENAGYTMPVSFGHAVMKFSYAMLGVVVSSLLIFLGLSVYNKIRSSLKSEITGEDEVLKTPKTKDDAIEFFIRKNCLR